MNKYYYFRNEIEKNASVSGAVKTFGKVLRAAGKHPGITLGALGGAVALSQVPRIANRIIGIYVMSNEPKKRKLMKKQLDALDEMRRNTSPYVIRQDPRAIPIVEDLA